MIPVLVRLLRGLRKTEIESAREILVAAVETARREQLLGADGAKRLAELVADQILTAVAAREREIRRLHAAPPREERNQLRVFVVRVRGDHEDPARDRGPAHQLVGFGGAALLRARSGGDKHQQRREGSRGAKEGVLHHTVFITPLARRAPPARWGETRASPTIRACSSACVCG